MQSAWPFSSIFKLRRHGIEKYSYCITLKMLIVPPRSFMIKLHLINTENANYPDHQDIVFDRVRTTLVKTETARSNIATFLLQL